MHSALAGPILAATACALQKFGGEIVLCRRDVRWVISKFTFNGEVYFIEVQLENGMLPNTAFNKKLKAKGFTHGDLVSYPDRQADQADNKTVFQKLFQFGNLKRGADVHEIPCSQLRGQSLPDGCISLIIPATYARTQQVRLPLAYLEFKFGADVFVASDFHPQVLHYMFAAWQHQVRMFESTTTVPITGLLLGLNPHVPHQLVSGQWTLSSKDLELKISDNGSSSTPRSFCDRIEALVADVCTSAKALVERPRKIFNERIVDFPQFLRNIVSEGELYRIVLSKEPRFAGRIFEPIHEILAATPSRHIIYLAKKPDGGHEFYKLLFSPRYSKEFYDEQVRLLAIVQASRRVKNNMSTLIFICNGVVIEIADSIGPVGRINLTDPQMQTMLDDLVDSAHLLPPHGDFRSANFGLGGIIDWEYCGFQGAREYGLEMHTEQLGNGPVTSYTWYWQIGIVMFLSFFPEKEGDLAPDVIDFVQQDDDEFENIVKMHNPKYVRAIRDLVSHNVYYGLAAPTLTWRAAA